MHLPDAQDTFVRVQNRELFLEMWDEYCND